MKNDIKFHKIIKLNIERWLILENFRKIKTAIIGLGVISEIYIENLVNKFSVIEVVACSDLNKDRELFYFEKYGIKALSIDEIIEDRSIEIVVNLTTPMVHYEITKKLLLGGKNVYTEKTLTTNLEDAKELIEIANSKNLYLGVAPDTFLGSAVQNARFIIDSKLIGDISSINVTLNRDGALFAERFPFTVKAGGGIGMDVGIYYITALISIFGNVKEVVGVLKTIRPERTHIFPNKEDFLETYTVENENLVSGILEFQSGIICNIHFNSNSIGNEKPSIIVYGTQGILYMPDPNKFSGDVKVLIKGQREEVVIPSNFGYCGDSRGIGVSEMAWSMLQKRPNRASKEMAYHAMEILKGIEISSNSKTFYEMKSTFNLPKPLPCGYLDEDYKKSDPEASLAL